ncbi:MAG: hypothetical protein AMXMBFR47_16330 [Planctomycetota bacterium]
MATFPWHKSKTDLFFGDTWVPLVKLRLLSGDGFARSIWFLVDTGAPISLARRSVAELLGIQLAAGVRQKLRGVGGGVTTTFVHPVRFELDRRAWTIDIAFADSDSVPNLLGRHGVFDQLSFRLDARKKQTTLGRRV